MGKIIEHQAARDIWASLNQVHRSSSIAIVMGLNFQQERIQKEGISMNEYLAQMKDIFDKHAAIGELLSYRDKLMFVFNGLREECDSFVTFILNRADKPSLNEIYTLLYSVEYRMEHGMTDQNINLLQANLSSYSNNERSSKSQSSYKNPSNSGPK